MKLKIVTNMKYKKTFKFGGIQGYKIETGLFLDGKKVTVTLFGEEELDRFLKNPPTLDEIMRKYAHHESLIPLK